MDSEDAFKSMIRWRKETLRSYLA